MLFSSPPRLTMRLIRVKGNRKRNSNYSIVAISVGVVTATKQMPDKSRFVLPCHCLSEPMEEITNCRLEVNFFMDRWNFYSTLKVQNLLFWEGGGRDSPIGLYFILLILSYWSSQQQVPILGFIEESLKFGPILHFFVWECKNSVKM